MAANGGNGAPPAPGALPKRVIIVGGVAGGASCAARLRRLTEDAQITVFERGPYVSFANCGLPYHVGDVIKEEKSLFVANAAKFNSWFNIAVKEGTEVVSIDRAARTVTARDVRTGEESTHEYDALVLSPGANAIKPPLPGITLPGIFQMKTVPDTRLVKEWIAQHGAKSAAVVGGGFIGLEMVENFVALGLKTSVIEMLPQVMPPYDPEMIEPLHAHMREKGVALHLGDGVAGFEQPQGGGLGIRTQSGATHTADLVILAIGVRPETALARACGLQLGPRGGIHVDEQMRTSDPAIWAVGDAVEVKDFVTGQPAIIPLAGPANRQGRIAANDIMGKEPSRFRGTQGTAVVGVFDMTCASTGASEKGLLRAGFSEGSFHKIYVHANNHAGYYPGAGQIDMKLLFDESGKILGCQALGKVPGVEKRVDVVSMCMQMGGTVYDLEEAELCYAPQYGSAKDVINFAGMVASNLLRGDSPAIGWGDLDWAEVAADPGCAIIDVREPSELDRLGTVPGAINIPISSLRTRMDEVPAGKKLYVYCQVGMRGHLATRQLALAGRDATNITGGYKSYRDFDAARLLKGKL